MARRFPGFRVSDSELENGVLAYVGDLIVDRGADRVKQPVALAYPAATPYSLPIVIPVVNLPDGTRWRLDEVTARQRIHRMPEGYRRHQMPGGSLCLVETESYKQVDVIGGPEILRRAKEVFKAVVLGKPYPYPDSEEAELEAHFEIVGDIVLTDAFLDPALAGRGRFFAFPHLDANEHSSAYVQQTGVDRVLLVGVNISQSSQGGLETDWRNAESETMVRVFPWLSHAAFSFEAMTADRRLLELSIEGLWYDLPKEPPPMGDGKDLESVLGLAGIADPSGELEKLQPRGKVLEPLVGFRFPSRGGHGFEWLVLRLAPLEDLEGAAIAEELRKNPSVVRDILRSARVQALRALTITQPSLELRNTGRVPESLHDKKVLVVGCGAMGGDVAVTLAKAGVGKLILLDHDIVRPGNAIRHVASLQGSGLKKVDAVRHAIWQHNPFVEVDVYHVNLTERLDVLEGLLSNCDLVVSTVADDNVDMVINETAVRLGRIGIFGRALRGGSAARVFRVRPEADPCMHCLALYAAAAEDVKAGRAVRGELEAAARQWVSLPELEGEVVGRECGNPILAGSAVDLRIAANFTTRAVLDQLGAGVEWNTLIWSADAIPGSLGAISEPCGLLRLTLPRHPFCPTCQRPATTSVLLTPEAKATIDGLVEARGTVETGGVLIGYRDANGEVHVLEATDAGPNAIEERGRFERDADHCQQKIEEAAHRLGQRGQYVGEWHSHLEAEPQPSARDVESLTGIAEAPNYLTDEPVMLIAGRDPATGKVHAIHASCFPIGKRHFERRLRVGAEA